MSGFIATFVSTFLQFLFTNDLQLIRNSRDLTPEEIVALNSSGIKVLSILIKIIISGIISLLWTFYIPYQFYFIFKNRRGIVYDKK